MSDRIFGLHPVLELLRLRGAGVTRIVIAAGRHDARLAEVTALAREAGVPVVRQPARALDRLVSGERHQGVVAFVGGASYAQAGEILAGLEGRKGLLVVLDGVEDPRNLGAAIRSAAAAGADGLFLPERGAAGLTPVAAKASAGAVERLPVARVGNIVSFLKLLKEKNIWVVGVDTAGAAPWTSFDLNEPVALVFGGEGEGLRRLARETCDVVLKIPMAEGIDSLNLSVAVGVVLFEAVRQRRAAATRNGEGDRPRGGA